MKSFDTADTDADMANFQIADTDADTDMIFFQKNRGHGHDADGHCNFIA